MFERYTEKARRVIFFARFEASAAGCSTIEVHHLLLGLMREDKGLAGHLVTGGLEGAHALSKQIEEQHPATGKRVATSVDLPLSQASKQALALGAEAAKELKHFHIGTAHLLLGIIRADPAVARLLRQHGVTFERVRTAAMDAPQELDLAAPAAPTGSPLTALIARLPAERWDAAAAILDALSHEYCTVSVTSSHRSFTFTFGQAPNQP